jgi:hypothetical protein
MRNVRSLSLALRLCAARAALPAALLAIGAGVLACDDENEPKTWVKRLDDPAQRSKAIDRLKHFYDDDMSKNGNNASSAEVKALLDTMAEPLAKTYVAGGLDDKTRVDLIKLIGDLRDPRTETALVKALKDFEPGKTDDDARAACESATYMAKNGTKLGQPLVDEIWNVFSKFRPSKAKSQRLMLAVHDAVLAAKDPSYGDKAVDKLKPAVTDDVDSKMDQVQWWQKTAIQIIKELKYTKAVKPLVVTLLTPSKIDLNGTVRVTLLGMAPLAEIELVKALQGTDPDYTAAGAAYKDKANLAIVADTLGLISRPNGRDAVVSALASADTDTTLTGLAQSLVQFPETPTIVPSFQAAYGKMKWSASVEFFGAMKPRAALLQAAANFYDPTLTDWLLKEMNGAPDETSKMMVLESAMKVMPSDKKAVVGAALEKAKASLDVDFYDAHKEMFDFASQVLDKCGTNAGCYVTALDDPMPQKSRTSFWRPMKATWMAVAYSTGDAAMATTRGELVKRLPKIKDAETRLSVAEAIDELAPKGDAAAADVLDKMVADDTKAGDKNLLAADDSVVNVALRLRARAAP